MLNIALVGIGFIGEEHVEAIRRTNLGRVVALVGRDLEKTRRKALMLGVDKVYDDIHYVLEDKEIQVVHICTPNLLHYPMVKKALEAGKHVVCEKPLTMTSEEARELVSIAEQKNLINAIHFNIRYYPLIRHAKAVIQKGEIGRVYAVTGSYLQDWLVKDTDYSWRLEASKSGETRAVGDIGTHWMDLVEYVTGLKITEVNADMGTFLSKRKKPKKGIETWSGKLLKNDDYEIVDIDTEDYASSMVIGHDDRSGKMCEKGITKKRLQKMLLYTADLLAQHTDLLSDIDSKFGDGDHGITVGRIANCIRNETNRWRDEKMGDFLDNLGAEIMNVNGGSAGPLWGTLFQGFGQGIENKDMLDSNLVKNMIEAGIEEMKTISNAGIGDKTMMDALILAGDFIEKNQSKNVEEVLRAAADGAEAGMKATENYVAKFGRAKSYGEQTLGFPDAGAVGIMYLFKGLYEGYMG